MLQALFDFVVGAVVDVAFELVFGGSKPRPRGQMDAYRDAPRGESDAFTDRQSIQDRRASPVYKKNLQRLIERNRKFEDARK